MFVTSVPRFFLWAGRKTDYLLVSYAQNASLNYSFYIEFCPNKDIGDLVHQFRRK